MIGKKYGGLLKRVLSLGVVATTAIAMVACGDDEDVNDNKKKTYTYNTFMESSPLCFNPHTWETSSDNVISKYCEMGLVDVQMKEDGSWEWVYEMADSITDITASFSDKEKFMSAVDVSREDGKAR